MSKLTKDFFTKGEVLFIGFSSNPKSFSRSVYKDFVSAGIKVYPIGRKKFKENDIEVFDDIKQLDHIPECAYILLNKDNAGKAAESLKGTPVKRIMFQDKRSVDEATLNMCKNMGTEVVIACPRMLLNKGFMHRLHNFIANR